MGGRLSKVMTSLRLGAGESMMFARPDIQRAHRFFLHGHTLRQLICLCRQVDDGSVASGVWCIRCLQEFIQRCWSGMSISLEESSPITKFTDALIRWDGHEFQVIPHHLNSPTAHSTFSLPRVRFVPSPLQPRRVAYLRSLYAGRLARLHQVCPGSLTDMTRGLWELTAELHRPPCKYSWTDLLRATHGHRHAWSTGALQRTRLKMIFLMQLSR